MSDSKASKVAFITGAASGIGRAVAQAFVERGYTTAIVDRDKKAGAQAEKELAELGECAFIYCDVTDDELVRQAVDATVEKFGRLDAAFNGAGMDGEIGKPTAECTMENWNRVMAVNLTSTFSCMRYQIPHMLKCGGGAIVNCSSVAGLVGAADLPAYVAAKHGVVGLTKAAAIEYAKLGISVNAVCPSMINTPMVDSLDQSIKDYMQNLVPIGRYGDPEDVASMVLWLCDDNSKYITGQAIAIDGGWTTR